MFELPSHKIHRKFTRAYLFCNKGIRPLESVSEPLFSSVAGHTLVYIEMAHVSRVIVSILLTLVYLSKAVDRSKFKTCDQSSFCK
jgi:hypothetical protein